jgi:hypothetical protein
MGGKRPRQSHGVSVLPDGAGVASVAERHTRGTGVLRLSMTHRLEPGGSGPEATRTRLPHHGGGNSPECRWADGEAVVTCCGVATAMSQGPSRVPPPSSDQQVNTGTVPGLPGWPRGQRGRVGLGTPSADRPGTGRSRRSSPRPGEPVTWRRTAVVSRRDWRLQCRKMRHRMVTPQSRTTSSTCRWVRGGGYRRCRPSFTVGRRLILVAGSTTCPQPRGPGRRTQPTAETMESPLRPAS